MPIHLHQDFLVGMPLLNFFAELQAWCGKVANVDNNKIVLRNRGNYSAGSVKISGGINVVASHPQHQCSQMLHGGIAVNKQNTGLASG